MVRCPVSLPRIDVRLLDAEDFLEATAEGRVCRQPLNWEVRMGNSGVHSQPVDSVVRELGANLDTGLTPEDARERLQKFGINELTERPGPGFLRSCGTNSTITW